MSIKLMALVWETRGHFTATEKSILLKIADICADDGTNAYPGVSKIAACCELDRRTVFANLNNLYEKKVLQHRNRIKAGNITSNIYTIDIKILKWMVDHPVDKPVHKPCKSQGKSKRGSDLGSLGVVI